MLALIKYLLKGLITIVLSPLIVLYFCLLIVYQIVHHLFLEVNTLFKFFRGKKITDDDEETKKYKELTQSIEPIVKTQNIKQNFLEITESEDDIYE